MKPQYRAKPSFERDAAKAEDQLMDPLLLAGDDVVPLVIDELPDKEMRLRRYAIGFLGNGRHTPALPASKLS